MLIIKTRPDYPIATDRSEAHVSRQGAYIFGCQPLNVLAGVDLLYFDGFLEGKDKLVCTPEDAVDLLREQPIKQLCRPTGRFVLVVEDADSLQVKTDIFAMRHLYVYESGEMIAVSNDILELTEFLRSEDIKIHLNVEAVAERLHTGQRVTEQLNGPETLLDEIILLRVGSEITISRDGWRISRDNFLDEFGALSRDQYEFYFERGLKRLVNSVVTGYNQGTDALTTGLSGGRDSRCILAAMVKTGIIEGQRLELNSKIAQPDDLAVARKLAGYYEVGLNGDAELRKFLAKRHYFDPASPNEGIDHWIKHTVGVGSKLGVTPYLTDVANTRVALDGGGGEILRDFYASGLSQQTIETFVEERVTPSPTVFGDDIVDLSRTRLMRELKSYDVDNDKLALRRLYAEWRNRIIFGGNVNLLFPRINPLMNPDLVAASFCLTDREERLGKVSLDIMLALEPSLAFMEFDKPQKNFDRDLIAESTYFRKSVEVEHADINEAPSALIDDPRVQQHSSFNKTIWREEAHGQLIKRLEEAVSIVRDSKAVQLRETYYTTAEARLKTKGPMNARGARLATNLIMVAEAIKLTS